MEDVEKTTRTPYVTVHPLNAILMEITLAVTQIGDFVVTRRNIVHVKVVWIISSNWSG